MKMKPILNDIEILKNNENEKEIFLSSLKKLLLEIGLD